MHYIIKQKHEKQPSILNRIGGCLSVLTAYTLFWLQGPGCRGRDGLTACKACDSMNRTNAMTKTRAMGTAAQREPPWLEAACAGTGRTPSEFGIEMQVDSHGCTVTAVEWRYRTHVRSHVFEA